ncbi:WD40 repeat-like protein, partial [Suillus decipiens]
IRSIAYFPDGRRMISGSDNTATQQWDIKARKKIQKLRVFCKKEVLAVAVSRDGRWVITSGGDWVGKAELKVCWVETGFVKKFGGHSGRVHYIDISEDTTLLASGANDCTARIWNLDTDKLVTTTKLILKPVMTLKGHGDRIQSISYFPDGQQMISGTLDKTTRKWGLKTGKDIQEARNICEKDVCEEAVSRNSRWVVTGDGDNISDEDDGEDVGELKACEVETGNVKKFEGHSRDIYTVDISADSTLLASESIDKIWNLETGKFVAGPFKSTDWVGAIRTRRRSLQSSQLG